MSMATRYSPRLLSLLVASVLSAGALGETTDVGAQKMGLSDYRYFVIYPHLEKALAAQKKRDEATALQEFEHIHGQAPDNVPLTLYLAEAYRTFGHNDKASRVLSEQLKKHPGDARLARALDAIPVKPESVTTIEQLRAQQRRCDAAPSARCRSEVGQNALRLGELESALKQLEDGAFAASSQGLALQNGILQRAIYLKQWAMADTLFARLQRQNALTDEQRQQWFEVLLAGRLDSRLDALRAQGAFNDAPSRLAYADALARRGDTPALQAWLAQSPPAFTAPEQEKSWLYLLSRYSADPEKALARFTAKFPENRRYVAGETLPAALKARNYAAAQRILDELPGNTLLDERLAVSVAQRNSAESVRLARQIYAAHPRDSARLETLSYQLTQMGQPRAAADLLLKGYPFPGRRATAQTLMQRLAGLLQSHPEWATPAQVVRLSQPLPDAEQRMFQARLPGNNASCERTGQILGDLSPAYDATTWRSLGDCYRESLPGMALYAYQQARQRQPDAYNSRTVAYQAYQVQDYATALNVWKTLRIADMSNQDVMAAADTAQAANDTDALARWLDEARVRGMDKSENYWWLHARRYGPAQWASALADYNRALEYAPTVRAYMSRAALYRQRGETAKAVSDYQNALRLDPNNAAVQAALGYALWDNREYVSARAALEKAHAMLPDDPALIRQLAFVNQRLDDIPKAQRYARLVVDDLNNEAQAARLNAAQRQERFDFRRLHEDMGRRWTFSLDSTVGLRSGAVSSTNNNVGGSSPGQSYRSYGQLEAEYRIGRNVLVDGDLLSAYSRVFAGSGDSGVVLPVKNPMLGAGVRWKPLRDYVFFLALEQQIPLDRGRGESDTMLRASASFLNSGKYSDEWHPNGAGWFANNLYLDAAQYLRQNNQAWTADYRASWHQKVAHGQTLEPYAHVQVNGYRDEQTRGAQLGGVGVRWNIWTGESRYNAWPHKVSLGLEYQRTFHTVNQSAGERNNAFVTLGVRW